METLAQTLKNLLQNPKDATSEQIERFLMDLKFQFLYGDIKILTGSSHSQLVERIAKSLGAEIIKVDIGVFPNQELKAQVQENVRGHDVFLIQSLHSHGSKRTIEETEFLADCVRDSARRVTGVFPWAGYSKQDRRTLPREARSFKVVAKRLSICGLTRALFCDLHNSAEIDFLDIPCDHVYLMRLIIELINSRPKENIVLGSPDLGSVKRIGLISDFTDIKEICVVTKSRVHETKKIDYEKSKLVGDDVKGKTVLFVDDLIQGGNTLANAAKLVKEAGASRVIAAAVHPDFTPSVNEKPSAFEVIEKSPLDEVIVVDTIPHDKQKGWSDKITVIDPAQFIATCISNLHRDKPLSPLFLKL